MDDLPPFVCAERDALIAEVHSAFEGVTRKGGVSWSEAYEIDMWLPPEEEQAARQAVARASDLDTSWTQLPENAEWRGEAVSGPWNFLDAIGFCYYLPAQMIYCLQGGYEYSPEGFIFHLTINGHDARDFKLERWSLLDCRQRQCVGRFLQYMDIVDGRYSGWNDAFNSYWKEAYEAPLA